MFAYTFQCWYHNPTFPPRAACNIRAPLEKDFRGCLALLGKPVASGRGEERFFWSVLVSHVGVFGFSFPSPRLLTVSLAALRRSRFLFLCTRVSDPHSLQILLLRITFTGGVRHLAVRLKYIHSKSLFFNSRSNFTRRFYLSWVNQYVLPFWFISKTTTTSMTLKQIMTPCRSQMKRKPVGVKLRYVRNARKFS